MFPKLTERTIPKQNHLFLFLIDFTDIFPGNSGAENQQDLAMSGCMVMVLQKNGWSLNG